MNLSFLEPWLPIFVPLAVAAVSGGVGYLLNARANALTPNQKQDWLHQAAAAALVVSNASLDVLQKEVPADVAGTLASQTNAYLSLHGVRGVRVTPQTVGLVLADLKLAAGTVSAAGNGVAAT